MDLSSIIRTETSTGEAISAGSLKLRPQTKSVRLVMPGELGGFAWERPGSVVTVDAEGHEQILRVRDRTRTIQVAILAGTTALVLALFTTRTFTTRRFSHD
jgi:hypothetical protein